MNDDEHPKPVNIDPRCIQEALRMYLQPIKHDDPQQDFYTIYRRETMEYDTEYMQKYNEDLNTTLIFAGLFSAVSSAFVLAVQPKLEPDSGGQSEAYLRAILLSLNPSIASDEDPAAPPGWSGPPHEIITTSNLMYASLLISLLAAFVAMLGKQWLNRYLRHTGGSMIERCGDRQRKFDGLEKWPFHFFIEILPIMLQIALLLLACGLSRYMWSIDTSVAYVIISFTAVGLLFYIGIVIAGTSSYECPFQTPASIALRGIKDSATTQKLLTSLSLSNFISLVSAAWMDARQGLVSASHRVSEIMRQSFSQESSPPLTISGVRNTCREVGHQAIILLLRIDRALGNTKQRFAQEIRSLGRRVLLPITTADVDHGSCIPLNSHGLRLPVRNLRALRKRNTDNARCVCWVLRNLTDPEVTDSAKLLAGTIRWFEDDSDYDPPFDLIVSTFDACFDSTGQLYPGMRDDAYFSARAILRINTSARLKSHDYASRYPIPAVSSSSFPHIDPDLRDILYMFPRNPEHHESALDFTGASTHTHTHSLWMSNFLVDLTRLGPNPTLRSYESYISVAATDDRATIANFLLLWYMFLGGRVEAETLWAVDKSDSLETILSHLSTRVTSVISNADRLHHLRYLLEFLVTWEKRPACLTPMAYQWCSAISEAAGSSKIHIKKVKMLLTVLTPTDLSGKSTSPESPDSKLSTDKVSEEGFSLVGYHCTLAQPDDASRSARRPQNLTLYDYGSLLPVALKIGFRLFDPDCKQSALRLNHTPHCEQMFKAAFSSDDDEVLADAVCVWITNSDRTPPGSFARYFAKRIKTPRPFSPRLRRTSIRVVERVWRGELEVAGSETVQLLDRLEVGMGDMVDKGKWENMLVSAMRLPAGLEILSSHYWCLLGKLTLIKGPFGDRVPRDMDVMRLLRENGDWERLEVWMVIMWRSLSRSAGAVSGVEDIEQITDRLLKRRPSAFENLKYLCGDWSIFKWGGKSLRGIYAKALEQQESLKSSLSL